MEAKHQVDSPKKSPVNKTPPADKDASTAAKDDTSLSSTPEKNSKSRESSATYQNTSDSKEEVDSKTANSHKEEEQAVNDASKTADHPIISVDIKKSLPYENTALVPQESKPDSDSDVSAAVVASVVTTAVVNEAALTATSADGHVINNTKVSSDSSKVVSVVERELNRLSNEIMTGETELKTVDTLIGRDSRTIPNGDIDHSPVTEENVNSTDLKDSSLKSHTDSVGGDIGESQSDAVSENQVVNGVKSNNSGAINGVPGVITVVAISKKDSSGSTTTVKDSDKESIGSKKSGDSKVPEADSAKADPSASQEDNPGDSKSSDSGGKGNNETDSEDVNQENTGDSNTKESSQDENLTDSAKLQNSALNTDKNEELDVISSSSKDGQESCAKEDIVECVDDEKIVSETGDNKEVDSDIINSAETISSPKILNVETIDKLSISEKTSETQDKASDVEYSLKEDAVSLTDEERETCDTKMTSETGEELPDSVSSEKGVVNKVDDKEMRSESESQSELLNSKDVDNELESCGVSVARGTCDVGVGLESSRTIRVASAGGGEEEVDGQEESAEVEVTDDQADDGSHDNLVSTESPCPGVASPSATPSRDSPSGSGKGEDVEEKPPSAASRSSIPDASVYEPPERRKSGMSTPGEDKKQGDGAEDHSEEEQKKESEKDEEETTEVGTEEAASPSVPEGSTVDPEVKANDDEAATEEENKADVISNEAGEEGDAGEKEEKGDEADVDSNVKGSLESEQVSASEKGETEENETEKGEIDEKEVEGVESKSGGEGDAPDTLGDEATGGDKDGDKEDERGNEGDSQEKQEDAEEEKKESQSEETPVEESETTGVAETCQSETQEQPEETAIIESEKEKEELDKDSGTTEITHALEEPATLVEEESRLEQQDSSSKEGDISEKEAGKEEEEEKEEEEQKEEETAEKEEEIGGGTENEGEIEAIGEAEVVKDEAEAEVAEENTQGAEEPVIETAIEVEEKKENEEDKEKEETEEDKEKEDKEKEVDEVAESKDGEEKEPDKCKEISETKEEGNEKETEEPAKRTQSPLKSPTKRTRSSEKSSRRGMSPASSPPKPLKTPPSPQKPQKITSPKKKNGSLSPIKTPKTPGSDTRKLPPIKAPVGLAPNPNLKNIRSKIGSFDNIRYKPGGGDKKVITKKLEWKATPKIGSLDHSFKEKKHSKSQSKLESKEGKVADEQNCLASGDEAENETAAADAPESLLSQEVASTSEMPVAIAAES